MTNEIITTFSSNITSIQLTLFDFGVHKPKFEEVLTAKFQTHETPRNMNKNLELLVNNHIEYITPTCPNCDSKHMIKQEYQERHPLYTG
jgi:hypothetical protein